MKHIFLFTLIALLRVGLCAAEPDGPRQHNSIAHHLNLEIIRGTDRPLIKPGDQGTEGIGLGLEGGTVIKQNGVYHLFTAETMRLPLFAHMRLGHWRSSDGVQWTRVATLFESDGDFTGKSTRASLWSPMPIYNEEENRWDLYYVAYRGKPNDAGGWKLNYEGRIWRAVSQTPGREGLGGPYTDAGIILQPDAESQPWEGLQGVDSFFPYPVGEKWYGFYGSAQTQAKPNPAYPKWAVGLAEAPRMNGPWKRCQEGNPVIMDKIFAENPVVTRLADGTYVALIDGSPHGTWGYSISMDGLHWSQATFVKMTPPLTQWWGFVRTPLSLIKEDDGTYTVFFTAHIKDSTFAGLGKVSVRVVAVGNQSPGSTLGTPK